MKQSLLAADATFFDGGGAKAQSVRSVTRKQLGGKHGVGSEGRREGRRHGCA